MIPRPLALLGLLALIAGCGDEDEPDAVEAPGVEVQDGSWRTGPAEPTDERLPCTSADEPANFTVYSLGPRLGDLELSAILRRCDKPYPGEPIRANSVSLIYGTCEIPVDPATGLADGGCAPPLEVQTSPACERGLADYGGGSREPLTTVRGVPATGSGSQLEIYSGGSTIVIHGGSKLARQAAEALVEVPREIPPAEIAAQAAGEPDAQLPQPEPGHLAGRLSCAN